MIEISELKPHPSPYPEQLSSLAADAKNDPAAFAGLYDYFVQPVYRYIRSRVETNAEAEDLTSQTFIAAFEGLRSYRERGYFSAWLFRIARSKLMDHFRKKRYEVSLESAENASGHE
ncbi:MAG: sigma-70 family RNA polymerase sigma factor, partial [Clostridia bacterium]|nr:sigma-70 family RNA polymerase sigma factor [Clostridia bacterium]